MKSIFKLFVLFFVICFWSIESQAQEKSKLLSKTIGSGQPIILIPGLTCSGDVWLEMSNAFKDDYELHILTLPGFAGNTPFKNLDTGFFEKSQLLILNYIEKNKINKPIIIGHSLGGTLALKIAAENPDKLSKLVIVDAFPYMASIRNPNITKEQAKMFAIADQNRLISNWEKPRKEKVKNQKRLLSGMISDSKKIDIATQWYLDSDLKTITKAKYELMTLDLRNALSNIKLPTLVLGSWVAGKPYGVTRKTSLELFKQQYKKLKNVEIDVSDIGKHFIMWDDPKFFNNKLSIFMKE